MVVDVATAVGVGVIVDVCGGGCGWVWVDLGGCRCACRCVWVGVGGWSPASYFWECAFLRGACIESQRTSPPNKSNKKHSKNHLTIQTKNWHAEVTQQTKKRASRATAPSKQNTGQQKPPDQINKNYRAAIATGAKKNKQGITSHLAKRQNMASRVTSPNQTKKYVGDVRATNHQQQHNHHHRQQYSTYVTYVSNTTQ